MSRRNFLENCSFKENFFVIFSVLRARSFRLWQKIWTNSSKLLSMRPVKFLRNEFVWEKNSPSWNYFQLLSVKIKDFGKRFTAWLSICILEIQKIFMRKIILANTGNFKVLPISARKHSGFLSRTFSARLLKLFFRKWF